MKQGFFLVWQGHTRTLTVALKAFLGKHKYKFSHLHAVKHSVARFLCFLKNTPHVFQSLNNQNCTLFNMLVGALIQLCAYESSLEKRYNRSGHLDRVVHRNAATASKQSLWCKNELQLLLCSQRAHGLWATGRCRPEIGFHFLPFECTPTHSKVQGCKSEQPGKANIRFANGPRSGQANFWTISSVAKIFSNSSRLCSNESECT